MISGIKFQKVQEQRRMTRQRVAIVFDVARRDTRETVNGEFKLYCSEVFLGTIAIYSEVRRGKRLKGECIKGKPI